MKKFIMLFIVLAMVTVVFANITIANLKKLNYSFSNFNFKLHNANDILLAFVNGVQMNFVLTVQNPTSQSFKFDNLYIEIYTPEGDLIAKPQTAVTKTKINKNGTTDIHLSYSVDVAGMYKMLNVHSKADLIQIFKNYVENDYFGKQIVLNGTIKQGVAKIDFSIKTEV